MQRKQKEEIQKLPQNRPVDHRDQLELIKKTLHLLHNNAPNLCHQLLALACQNQNKYVLKSYPSEMQKLANLA